MQSKQAFNFFLSAVNFVFGTGLGNAYGNSKSREKKYKFSTSLELTKKKGDKE
jgi:hypothetical protein